MAHTSISTCVILVTVFLCCLQASAYNNYKHVNYNNDNDNYNNNNDELHITGFKRCPFNPPQNSTTPLLCTNLPANSKVACLQEPDKIRELVSKYKVPVSYVAFISNAALNQLQTASTYFANIAKNKTAKFERCYDVEKVVELAIAREEIGWGRTQVAITLMCSTVESRFPIIPFAFGGFMPEMAYFQVAKIANREKMYKVGTNYYKAALGYVAYAQAAQKNSTYARNADFSYFLNETDIYLKFLVNHRCKSICNKCCKDCEPCNSNATGLDCGVNSATTAASCEYNCISSANRSLALSDIHRTAIMWYSMLARENQLLFKLHQQKEIEAEVAFNMATTVPVTLPLIEALEELPPYNNWVSSLQLQYLYWAQWHPGQVFFTDAPLSSSVNFNFPRPDDPSLSSLCAISPIQAFIHTTKHGKLIQGMAALPVQEEVLFAPNSLLLVNSRVRLPSGKLCLYLEDFDYHLFWAKQNKML